MLKLQALKYTVLFAVSLSFIVFTGFYRLSSVFTGSLVGRTESFAEAAIIT